jgi:threonylcarbamoyladenosine tRNA methylthiotransferase MtaB
MSSEIQTVSFKTLGCRLNQSETDAIEAKFRERNYTVVPFGETADLTIINTCTVTNEADRAGRYEIRKAVRFSRKGRIVVTGCYAQIKPEEIRTIDGVDLILGNQEKYKIFDYLDRLEKGKEEEPLVFVTDSRKLDSIAADGFVSAASRTRAFLKIQDGCDYYCSFCIIPFARGRARSRPFYEALDEAKKLADLGYREIVLTGVNIGTYCSEENGRPRRFVDLVDRLQQIGGLARLRISSIEPNTVTDSLLMLMGRSKVICPHLHIPIQSASDALLSAMRRKYRRARIERLMDKIKTMIPEAGVGTDIIIGFPDETEERFEETLRFVETAGFSYLHIFPFSPRDGTPAAKLANAVPLDVIRRRAGALRAVSKKLRADFASRFVGRTLSVLFEEPDGDLQAGYTPNYIRVRVRSNTDWQGELREVRMGTRLLSPAALKTAS